MCLIKYLGVKVKVKTYLETLLNQKLNSGDIRLRDDFYLWRQGSVLGFYEPEIHHLQNMIWEVERLHSKAKIHDAIFKLANSLGCKNENT
jgi:hypothetical protein